MSTGLAGTNIICSMGEILRLDPPEGETCGSYLNSSVPAVLNPDATSGCQACMYTSADSLLAYFGMQFNDRWWDWAVTVAYNVANIVLGLLLYRITRV
jgi:ATP-binding cassette subfamily G (WHITE) protein 2 (PDR)